MRWMVCCLLLMAAGAGRAPGSRPGTLVVVGEGMATLENDASVAEENAIWDAKRNAVEQAAGVFLKSRTVGRNFEIEEDEIQGRSHGFVRNWKVIAGSRAVETLGNGKVLRLKIRATVALLPVLRRLSDMKDVYHDLERPLVLVDG